MRGELRIGVTRSTGTARLKIGDPALPNLSFDSGGAFLAIRRDTLDDPQFPRSGTSFALGWTLERPGLGSDIDADLVTLQWDKVSSFGRHSVAVGLDLATTEGDDTAIQNFYSLGGFLNLSGLDRDQLTGPHAALARAVYYRRLGDADGGLFEWPLYAGFSAEAGNVWQRRSAVRGSELIYNGSLFVGMDTFFGPLFFAAGFSENGDTSLYLFLGAPF